MGNKPVKQNNQAIIAKQTQTLYSGPIPSAEELQKYKEVYPEAPKIIMEVFQKQTDHRINIENIVIKSNTRRATLATMFAFILGLAMISGAIYLMSKGMYVPGYSTLGTAILTLAGSFLYGTKNNRQERTDKELLRKSPGRN